MMIIQVIACEIGKYGCIKMDCRNASLVQAVAGYLRHSPLAAMAHHFCQVFENAMGPGVVRLAGHRLMSIINLHRSD